MEKNSTGNNLVGRREECEVEREEKANTETA